MELYDYLFWYNPFENLWYAFEKERYVEFFNGDKTNFPQNENFEVLITQITENGDSD